MLKQRSPTDRLVTNLPKKLSFHRDAGLLRGPCVMVSVAVSASNVALFRD